MFVSSSDGYSEWYCASEVISENATIYNTDYKKESKYRKKVFVDDKWKFKKVFGDKFPKDFKNDSSKFEEVSFPHIISQEIYSGDNYPWKECEEVVEPYAPKQFNQLAWYEKSFEIDDLDKKYTIVFESVASCFYLYVNDARVGFYKNSFARSEFDITDFLKLGLNKISVEVHCFSTSSWLEGVDAWNLAGIFGKVDLFKSEQEHIFDFKIKTNFDDFDVGSLKVDVIVCGNTENKGIELTVFDCENQVVAMDNGFVKSTGECSLEAVLPNVKRWSDEIPNLYNIKMVLREKFNIIDEVNFKTGFRTIEISGGKLLVNSKYVKIRGVNLKQFDGGLLDEKRIEEEIISMKKANINAIRTFSHPFPEYFYNLCDKYGIYVFDECNIDASLTKISDNDDTYLPASKGEWTLFCKDRVEAMYHQHKNYTCIISWSIGNCCGGGNSILMREYLENLDSSRFLFLQNDKNMTGFSSFVALNVPESVDTNSFERYLNSNIKTAVLLSEISSSKSKVFGGLSDYIYLNKVHSNLVGGFLSFWGDIKSSKSILKEVKEQYSPIDFIEVNAKKGIFDVVNNNVFTDLSKFTIYWKATTQDKKIGQGFVVIPAESGSVVRVELPVPKENEKEWFLTLSALTVEKNKFSPKATEVCSTQFIINEGEKIKFERQSGKTPELTQRYDEIVVECEGFKVCFDKKTALMSGLIYENEKIFKNPLKPTFWRNPTKADILNDNDIKSAMWKNIQNRTRGEITNTYFSENENKVIVETTLFMPTFPQSKMDITYTFYPESIDVNACFECDKRTSSMSEFGLMFEFVDEFNNIEYFGKGPFENYCDRNLAEHIGVYNENLTENKFNNHTKVRYAEIFSEKLIIRIEGDKPFEVSALKKNGESQFTSSTILKIDSWQLGSNEKIEENKIRECELNFSIIPLSLQE